MVVGDKRVCDANLAWGRLPRDVMGRLSFSALLSLTALRYPMTNTAARNRSTAASGDVVTTRRSRRSHSKLLW